MNSHRFRGGFNATLRWLVVPVWFVVLWLNACMMCAVVGLHVAFTAPMIFLPLATIMCARERYTVRQVRREMEDGHE